MATSPPHHPLALPRQRPTLALPTQQPSRKPSISSTTSSAHPLRQTSFPPPQSSLEAQHAAALQQYSPTQTSIDGEIDLAGEFGDLSDGDSEIVSAISAPISAGGAGGVGGGAIGGGSGGTGVKKRKRGEKRPKGRPPKVPRSVTGQSVGGVGDARTGSASLVNGESSSRAGTRGATADADDEDGENDNDDEEEQEEAAAADGKSGRQPMWAGGEMTQSELDRSRYLRSTFRRYLEHLDNLPLNSTKPSRDGLTRNDFSDRYDTFSRARLRSADVRKLINQTLSQSVPANVVLVVGSLVKLFAGELIENAREVQGEWMGIDAKRADGEENEAWARLKKLQDFAEVDGVMEQENAEPNEVASSVAAKDENSASTPIKTSQSPPETQPLNHTSTTRKDDSKPAPVNPGGAGGLLPSIMECDRGPLLPDHLREALRRYKKVRSGGTAGFTGLSLEGRENSAVRMGGRGLFR